MGGNLLIKLIKWNICSKKLRNLTRTFAQQQTNKREEINTCYFVCEK